MGCGGSTAKPTQQEGTPASKEKASVREEDPSEDLLPTADEDATPAEAAPGATPDDSKPTETKQVEASPSAAPLIRGADLTSVASIHGPSRQGSSVESLRLSDDIPSPQAPRTAEEAQITPPPASTHIAPAAILSPVKPEPLPEAVPPPKHPLRQDSYDKLLGDLQQACTSEAPAPAAVSAEEAALGDALDDADLAAATMLAREIHNAISPGEPEPAPPALRIPIHRMNTSELKSVFSGVDANGDGKVSQSELRAALQKGDVVQRLLEAAGGDPDNYVMAQLDMDGDGKVSWDEFEAMLNPDAQEFADMELDGA